MGGVVFYKFENWRGGGVTYRIIPKISPGRGLFSVKAFFLAYFRGEAYFRGGAYFRDEIRVRKEDGLIIEGCISATVIKKD